MMKIIMMKITIIIHSDILTTRIIANQPAIILIIGVTHAS